MDRPKDAKSGDRVFSHVHPQGVEIKEVQEQGVFTKEHTKSGTEINDWVPWRIITLWVKKEQ